MKAALPRTATVAWSPHGLATGSPLLATGTVSGALDDSFSSDSVLELWQPDYTGRRDDLKPLVSLSTGARFHRLKWGYVAPARPSGVLAAGLDNGEFAAWDADKLLAGSIDDAQIFRNNRHRGPVRGVDFNKLSPNLLGSGGVNGEIYIWDLHDPRQAYSPGERSAKLGDITALAWNNKVPPILASASNSGNTVVWDLRNKSEVSCLTYGGAGPAGAAFGAPGARAGGTSSVAWHPHTATRLVTASEDDANPVIAVWNLRNAHAPEILLQGHTRGILSVGWCQSDEDLLVSCGKDNRTLLWNPQTGQNVGELSPSTNWTFDAQWCPRDPNLIATASFDGQIGVHSLQSIENDETAAEAAREQEQAAAVDDNDFFNNLPSVKAPVLPGVSLIQPPKWLRRPVTASFSFGGQLVSVHPNRSGVHVRQIVTEPGIVDRAERLQQAVANGTLIDFAREQGQAAEADTSNPEEASNWAALQTLFNAGARDELVTLLGVTKQELEQKIIPALEQAKATLGDLLGPSENDAPAQDDLAAPAPQTDPFSHSDANGGEDFFDNLGAAPQATPAAPAEAGAAATVPEKGPFSIYPPGERDVDQDITRALVLGDFESAVSLCLSVERYADAILLAVRGGDELLAKTQTVYFNKKSESSPFLRVYQSIVSEDLADVVAHADLADWQETFVILCTYAKSEDFGVLAEALGQRLEDLYYSGQAPDARKNATVCYLAAGRLEKMAQIWGDEMAEQEAAILAAAQDGSLDPAFSQRGASSAHAEALQAFIEKIMVFESAVGYVDVDLQNAPGSVPEDGYKLAPLYDRLLEYVNLLADQGLTDAAASFLRRTPPGYLALKGADAALELLQAKGVATSRHAASGYGQASLAAPANPYGSAAASRSSPYAPSAPAAAPTHVGGAYGGSSYAPPTPAKSVGPAAAVSNSPYAPVAPMVPTVEPPAATANAYAPSTNPYAPAPGMASSPANSFAAPYGASPYGAPVPPPPTTAQTMAAQAAAGATPVSPPPKRDVSGWNDIPALAARRPASGMGHRAAPITAPFPNMPAVAAPGQPPMGPPQGPPRGLTPRGSAVGSPGPAGGPPMGPPMRARTPGMPIPGSPAGSMRGAAMGPPRGSLSGAAGQGVLSPPMRARTPMAASQPNPYAPPAAAMGAQHQGGINGFRNSPAPGFAPLAPQGPGGPAGFVPPPPQGPARMGTPGLPGVGAGPPLGSGAGAPPARSATPVAPGLKYPPGDRSHVPAAHKPIVGVLSGEVAKFRASGVPKRMADDVEGRVGILLDALNNEIVPEPVIALLHELCKAIVARNAPAALDIHVQLATIVSGDLQRACVGIKQLVSHMR